MRRNKLYICSISPRQRVDRRATRCMTMMLLKWSTAALFVHLVLIFQGQHKVSLHQISNMLKMKNDCEVGFHQQQQLFLFESVSGKR